MIKVVLQKSIDIEILKNKYTGDHRVCMILEMCQMQLVEIVMKGIRCVHMREKSRLDVTFRTKQSVCVHLKRVKEDIGGFQETFFPYLITNKYCT